MDLAILIIIGIIYWIYKRYEQRERNKAIAQRNLQIMRDQITNSEYQKAQMERMKKESAARLAASRERDRKRFEQLAKNTRKD